MKLLRLIIVILFAAGLAVGTMFALAPGAGGSSGGWWMTALISAAGLAWIFWGTASSAPVSAPALPLSSESLHAIPRLPPNAPNPSINNKVAAEIARPVLVASGSAALLFEQYFERAPVPLLVMNREGHITRMNRAAESVTQYAAAEIRSVPYWSIFLSETEVPATEERYRAAMLERQAPPCKENWRTRMGSQAQFEWWRTVLTDDFGQATGVLAAALPLPSEPCPVNVAALADQLTAVNGYSEYLLMSMDEQNPLRRDLESIHRAGMAASSSLGGR